MESLNMNNLILLSLVALITACNTSKQHSSHDDENMDVVTLSKNMEGAMTKQTDTSPVAPAAAFNWQKYFRGTPNAKERPMLQQSLQQLSSAKTFEELMKRARNESALGLVASAESSYRQALRKDGKNIDAMLELAAILQKQKRPSQALDVLAEAKTILTAQERPNQDQVFKYRYTLAMTYLQVGDRNKAHSILSDLVGTDRTFLPGYAALAFSYLKDGKDSVAKFIVDQAMDRGGEHPALYNILGILQERQSKPAVAKDFYNRALTMNEFFAPALVNRANLYLVSGEVSMAENDYKKALDAEPSNTDAMIGLGVVYRQSGRFTAAKDTLERALDLEADNPQARFNLAILMRENLKDEGLALRYFSEVVQSERANQSLRTMAKSAIEEIRSL